MYMYGALTGGLFLTVSVSCFFKKKKFNKMYLKEYVIAGTFFLLLMFWFMGYNGVLESGYHLVDDHEVYTIGRDFSDFGFWRTMSKWLSNDLHSRFRFSYFLIRVTECYFFKDNFVLWHIFQTFTAAAGLFFSYVFARRMKCSIWVAYIFSISIFIGGGQSAVWWRLGPQENLGVIFLMLTLISLQSYLETNRTRHLILSSILTVFLGGIKESFLLLLPLLPIWIAHWEISQNDWEISWKNVWKVLKKRWSYLIITYFVFMIDLLIILLYVGTNKYGYAGIDTSYGIWDYVSGIAGIVSGRLGLYIKMTVIGIGFVLIPAWILYIKNGHNIFRFWIPLIIPFFVFTYFLGVQMILHTKSGMYERYLLPCTIAFAYFWLIDIYHFFGIERRLQRGYYIFAIFMILALIMGVNDEERAYAYAEDGKNTTAILSKVAEYTDENPNIVVGIGYEEDFAVSVYLQEKCNIKSTYNLFYSLREDNAVYDGYIYDMEEKESITLDEAQIFIGSADKISSIKEKYGGRWESFASYTYGDYVLYEKLNNEG